MQLKCLFTLYWAALFFFFAPGNGLTVNPFPDSVGAQELISGKVPDPAVNVYVIVNPVETPQQYWVQKKASVDNKRNWTTTVHFGDPGSAHQHQQFKLMVVADPQLNLHESDVLSDWPNARWRSEIFTVVRK